MSLGSFAENQKARLEALREATRREKAILETPSNTVPVTDRPPQPLIFPTASVVDSSFSSATELRMEEEEVSRKERLLDERIAAAEERKRELLASLLATQYREREAKDQLAQVQRMEEQVRQQEEEARARQRDLSSLLEQFQLDLANRNAKVTTSRRRLDERRTESTKAIEKMKQQIYEQEERVRAVEAQISIRKRKLDDDEREQVRQELKLRDAELSAIFDLKLEIERRRGQLQTQ